MNAPNSENKDAKPSERSNSLAFDEYVNNNFDANYNNKNFTLGVLNSGSSGANSPHRYLRRGGGGVNGGIVNSGML